MPIVVNTNTQSVFAQRALNKNTMGLQKNIEQLSTGFRINRAADDAAGLSITEKMTSKIRGIDQAQRNIGDGIALIQTTESALGVVQDNLQRVRELTVQALNETNSLDERNAIQREINARVEVIESIGASSNFNGVQLIATATGGTTSNIRLQTGPDDPDRFTIAIDAAAGVRDQGIVIDMDLADGAVGNEADGTLTQDSNIAVGHIWVVGAKASNGGVKSYLGGEGGNHTAGYNDGAVAATILADIDNMINNASRMRSQLGAYQNALESRQDYLGSYSENLQGARSRIKDADVAKISSEFVKNQILQQSSSGMLSQANQSAQIALNLLP